MEINKEKAELDTASLARAIQDRVGKMAGIQFQAGALWMLYYLEHGQENVNSTELKEIQL